MSLVSHFSIIHTLDSFWVSTFFLFFIYLASKKPTDFPLLIKEREKNTHTHTRIHSKRKGKHTHTQRFGFVKEGFPLLLFFFNLFLKFFVFLISADLCKAKANVRHGLSVPSFFLYLLFFFFFLSFFFLLVEESSKSLSLSLSLFLSFVSVSQCSGTYSQANHITNV